jgi:hypothetical protein
VIRNRTWSGLIAVASLAVALSLGLGAVPAMAQSSDPSYTRDSHPSQDNTGGAWRGNTDRQRRGGDSGDVRTPQGRGTWNGDRTGRGDRNGQGNQDRNWQNGRQWRGGDYGHSRGGQQGRRRHGGGSGQSCGGSNRRS